MKASIDYLEDGCLAAYVDEQIIEQIEGSVATFVMAIQCEFDDVMLSPMVDLMLSLEEGTESEYFDDVHFISVTIDDYSLTWDSESYNVIYNSKIIFCCTDYVEMNDWILDSAVSYDVAIKMVDEFDHHTDLIFD